MNDDSPYLLGIGDDDIEWVCRVLNLPPTAFSGKNGNDPRLDVIKSLSSLDVEACPGSGKTTLLVAKLAILARHWTERRRGICVLSHTNVARREIETRLGGTPEGKLLLSYPHFVGTIHGFVNEFLALPWLRSKPYPSGSLTTIFAYKGGGISSRGKHVSRLRRTGVTNRSCEWSVRISLLALCLGARAEP